MLDTAFQEYIHLSRYARWKEDDKRRETWDETVSRLSSFLRAHVDDDDMIDEIHSSVLNLEVMPSMRLMMTAGPAAEKDNVAIFNCSYAAVNHPRVFDEILYILMCGTGVGFSVERQEISKLPEVPQLYPTDTTIVVHDSKIGWSKAYKQLITLLYSGEIPSWDVSKVRPAGRRLKTFGGRSSGPAPLEELFSFTINIFKSAQGRKLNSLEVHDIVCKIGDIVVVGGVRRSALISLSNLSDDRMRDAKSGNWWDTEPQRRLANNSAAYTEKPEVGHFMKEWLSLYESKSGERGIFNRQAAHNKMEESGRLTKDKKGDPLHVGTNPCGEILLRDGEFCNLSEVVCRHNDTPGDLERKVKIATTLGTIQSKFTEFRYLRPHWKRNCDEERLLGVSLTGIMDCKILNKCNKQTIELLQRLRRVAKETNEKVAKKIDVSPSVSITCVKPSGTVSSLVDTSPGIHTRFANKYIRRARSDIKDPLTTFMIEAGFPYEEDLMNSQNIVFEFPVRSPRTAVTRTEQTAVEALEIWKMYREHWCDHNPSVTINVKEEEWPQVGSWVWNNFDQIGGVSFLPYSDHVYRQAPYEEVDDDALRELERRMPSGMDWKTLVEDDDETTSSQEFACTGGSCDVL